MMLVLIQETSGSLWHAMTSFEQLSMHDMCLVSEFEDLLSFCMRNQFPFLASLITYGKCEMVALQMKANFVPKEIFCHGKQNNSARKDVC